MIGNQLPIDRGAEAMRHHHAAAADERRDSGDDLSIDVIKRQGAEHAIGSGEGAVQSRRDQTA